MNGKKPALMGLYVLLSIINTIVGLSVAAVMMGGSFIGPLLGSENQPVTNGFDSFFLHYVLHPAMGTLYVALLGWLVVYQNNIKQTSYRLTAHLAFLLLSSLILMKVGLVAANVYGY